MWPLAAISFIIWFILAYRVLTLSLHRFCDDSTVMLLGRQLHEGESIQNTLAYSNLRGVQLTLFQTLSRLPPFDLHENLTKIIRLCEEAIVSDHKLVRTLIHIAPLLGLLGTVWGMIETFSVISIVGTSEPKMMAFGISQAMLTTQAGLLIAVPSIFVEKRSGRRESWILHKLEENRLILLQCFCGKPPRNSQ